MLVATKLIFNTNEFETELLLKHKFDKLTNVMLTYINYVVYTNIVWLRF